MATEKEIDDFLMKMNQIRPNRVNRDINSNSEGLKFALMYIGNVGRPVSAGELSRISCVSTARTAAMIKKLQAKGLIVKNSDSHDARKSMLTLSDEGREKYEQTKEVTRKVAEMLIDKYGVEKLNEVMGTIHDIHMTIEAYFQGEKDAF